jgi:hypothetical protein
MGNYVPLNVPVMDAIMTMTTLLKLKKRNNQQKIRDCSGVIPTAEDATARKAIVKKNTVNVLLT